jgi:metal-sulfur cluster biosynthetic enzyme
MIRPPVSDWTEQTPDEKAYGALSKVWDPELGLDIVALGLVYDVIADETSVEVIMTLTTPGCPVSEQLPARGRGGGAAGDARPRRSKWTLVWDPPWTPELLTPMALERLGFNRYR